MAYGKEIFRNKYKESYDCCQKIINNYYDLDQEYQIIAKELQQKENIIKEVREYVSKIIIDETYTKCILEILDKENKGC